ncbi:type II toxin-antitoxin system RelE/ParE family toxin [Myxococcota bacterium]|nr:type II toxin-antitoxin system RelE/ParE family toxin [Myxococcota bacterium]
MKIIWSPTALKRLLEIEDYIAEENPLAAERLIDKLIEQAEKLSAHPNRGRPVPELAGSVFREIIWKNYRIIYRTGEKSVDIITVFESHRLLREEELDSE